MQACGLPAEARAQKPRRVAASVLNRLGAGYVVRATARLVHVSKATDVAMLFWTPGDKSHHVSSEVVR